MSITVIEGDKPAVPVAPARFVIALCDNEGTVVNSIEVDADDLLKAKMFGFVAFKMMHELLDDISVGEE